MVSHQSPCENFLGSDPQVDKQKMERHRAPSPVVSPELCALVPAVERPQRSQGEGSGGKGPGASAAQACSSSPA